MEKLYERAWADISLESIRHNYLAMKAKLPEGCAVAGIVKANAYGHGARQVAQTLEKAGCRFFCVASIGEALELRKCTEATILILGATPPELTKELIDADITQTVGSTDAARDYSYRAQSLGKRLKAHIKLDTGMGRLGFNCRGDSAAVAEIAGAAKLPGLDVGGVFTHFPLSDVTGEGFTREQYGRFTRTLQKLEAVFGIKFAIRHCTNSGALINCDYSYLDMVRPGISLYGCYPGENRDGLELREAMSLRARIVQVSDFEPGETVGYGRTWTAQRRSKIAVVSVGYADGFMRALSNRCDMLVHGVRVPQVGRICMDIAMIDVTDVPGVIPGDTATVFGRDGDGFISIDECAKTAGTISYEVMCTVSARVPRYYE